MIGPTAQARMLVRGRGELGKALLAAPLPRAADRNVPVDPLVRPGRREGGEAARALGATLVEGDIAAASKPELARLFASYGTVLSCVGFAAGPGTQMKLARSVLGAGVRRYFSWQFGVDSNVLGRGSPQPLFDEQLDVRAALRSQHNTRRVIVSVGMFTSFLFEPSFGVVDLHRGSVRALGGWDNAVTLTTPEDIGRLTAEIVFTEPEFADEVVHLAGDTITYRQLARIVETALRRPIEREVWDVQSLMDELSQAPADAPRPPRAVFAGGCGMSWNKAERFNGRQGIHVTGAAGWLKGHLASKSSADKHEAA